MNAQLVQNVQNSHRKDLQEGCKGLAMKAIAGAVGVSERHSASVTAISSQTACHLWSEIA